MNDDSKNIIHTIKVHAVVIRSEEILITIHDDAFGGFMGLPDGFVTEDEQPRNAIERVIFERTGLEVTVGRLLGIDHTVFHQYRLEQYERTEVRIDMAFLCDLKTDNEIVVPTDIYIHDASIIDVSWINIDEFNNDYSSMTNEFCKRVIRVAHTNDDVELVENPPFNFYI